MALTKEEIISAAFEVWSGEIYQKTSLSELARFLGITKPAIYRYFKSKECLLNAMSDKVFGNFAECIKEALPKAENGGGRQPLISVNTPEGRENLKIFIRAIALYLGERREDFTWLIIHFHGDYISRQIAKRGVDFSIFSDTASYPPVLQLVFSTVLFFLLEFHRQNFEKFMREGAAEEASKANLDALAENIVSHISRGLGVKTGEIERLPYEKLEMEALSQTLCFREAEEHNKLLSAAAAAAAEFGFYNVSVEEVAKKAGLSKSSLYSHFESREDMMLKLLLTEFERVVLHGEACARLSDVPLESLYLSIVGVAFYFRLKPDVLVILDKLKTQKPDLTGNRCREIEEFNFREKLSRILPAIPASELAGGGESLYTRNNWILFLTVILLQHRPEGMTYSDICNESFRTLFYFITKGIE